MAVWRKKTTQYHLDGKQVPAHTKGAKKRLVESRRWYGTIRLQDGKTKQVPLAEDEETAERLLQQLQQEQHERRLNGTTTFDDAKLLTLAEVLDAYLQYLTSKGNTPEYLKTTRQRLEKLFKGLKAKTIGDLDSTRILKLLSDWRTRKIKGISIGTSNHYIVAAKSLSKWFQRERMTTDDRLIALRKMNSQTDRRRVRRAFTLEELNTLCLVTQQKRKRFLGHDWHFTAESRVWLYRLAAFTGLRANELASLTTNSFDFVAKTFVLEAKSAKNRKRTVLPLHPSLCESLPAWFRQLQQRSPHFTRQGGRHVAPRRVSADADSAAQAAAPTALMPLPLFPGSWTRRRLAGQFLKRCGIPTEDTQGRVLDFHSLRYTFITMLARAGVHPAKAQRLARHSSIHLTMNVYTMLDTDDLRDAVDSLPSMETT